jgi:ribosome-binding factor A
MATRRQERVSERIHHEISDLLQNEIRDPRLAYVTVTDVEISPDLELATVFVSALGDQDARSSALAALERGSGYIRRELARRLGMRVTPALRFMLDESWERGAKLDTLLDKLAGAPPGADGASAPPAQQGDAPGNPSGSDSQDASAEPGAGADLPVRWM